MACQSERDNVRPNGREPVGGTNQSNNSRDPHFNIPSPTSPELCTSPTMMEFEKSVQTLTDNDSGAHALHLGGNGALFLNDAKTVPAGSANMRSFVDADMSAYITALAHKLCAQQVNVCVGPPLNSTMDMAPALPRDCSQHLVGGGLGASNGLISPPNIGDGTGSDCCSPRGEFKHYSVGAGNRDGSCVSTLALSGPARSNVQQFPCNMQHQLQEQQRYFRFEHDMPQQQAADFNEATMRDRSLSTGSSMNHAGYKTPTSFSSMHAGRYHAPSGPSPTTPSFGFPSLANELFVLNKFGTLGTRTSEFNSPFGFCLGINGEIIVADTKNHRIQVFDNEGKFRHAFGLAGRDEGRLWHPRKVAYLRRSNRIAVFDEGVEGSRMQFFAMSGDFLRKVNISFVDVVAGITTTRSGELVIVDSVKPTCFTINEAGDLKKWFDCSKFMTEPSDVAVWNGNYYICDFKEHCICVFDAQGRYARKIGGKHMTDYPNGIDITAEGQILVADSHGNRMHVCVLDQTGSRLADYECSQKELPKVSRCYGLKMTSNQQLVSIVRNTNMVLIMSMTQSDPRPRYYRHNVVAHSPMLLERSPVAITPLYNPVFNFNNVNNNAVVPTTSYNSHYMPIMPSGSCIAAGHTPNGGFNNYEYSNNSGVFPNFAADQQQYSVSSQLMPVAPQPPAHQESGFSLVQDTANMFR